MPAIVDPEKCKASKDCIEACPNGSISMPENVAVVNKDECIDCGACVDACPEKAISMED